LSQPADCTVLIAAADLLAPLTAQLAGGDKELLAFADADALRALEAISRRRPRLVVLERSFAATPRGVALINRLEADPMLSQSEIRVVADAAAAAGLGAPSTAGTRSAVASQAPALAPTPTASVLDLRGTRRAPRFVMTTFVEVDLNGNKATVIDLSACGAQVVSTAILRPNQRVRVTLVDEEAAVRCSGVVAWANFEMPAKAGPRYRAGIEFLDAPAGAVDAFRIRRQR
jgi:hypothetical protein